MTDETTYEPIPVKGYTEQSKTAIALANEGKELEERCRRWLEKVQRHVNENRIPLELGKEDLRYIFLTWSRQDLMNSFMWGIRAIFNPERIKLPEDNM